LRSHGLLMTNYQGNEKRTEH